MAMVLVPGFMLDDDLWTDILPQLTVFGPVQYADPRTAISIRDMADKTLAAAPSTFALIGFSMGGYVAREMVRTAPDRVTHLLLIATSARGDREVQAQRERAAAARSVFKGISAAAIRTSLAPDREGDTALVRRIQNMSLRLGGNVFQHQALFRRSGDLDRLGDIDCPTLIVAGRQDRLRSLEEAYELHAGIPGSILRVIDCGHMIPLEAPVELGKTLQCFLRKNPD